MRCGVCLSEFVLHACKASGAHAHSLTLQFKVHFGIVWSFLPSSVLFCLSRSFFPSVLLYVFLSVCRSGCLSLSACLSLCPLLSSPPPNFSLFLSLSLSHSVCLSVCLSLSLSLSLSLFSSLFFPCVSDLRGSYISSFVADIATRHGSSSLSLPCLCLCAFYFSLSL